MCFSAAASFSASAVLVVVGTMTWKSTQNRRELLLASIRYFSPHSSSSKESFGRRFSTNVCTA
jgi:hypothetical protein